MADQTTFAPAYGQGVTVAPGASTASTAIAIGSKSLCLTNLGTFVCYVRVTQGASSATIADYPVVPGGQVSISTWPNADTVSYISPAGATSLHIIPGTGF